jgi:hypothetical protein
MDQLQALTGHARRLLEPLYVRGDLPISAECCERLRHISPASMDRLRGRYGRRPVGRRSRSRTKPGTLLKDQIPIRTRADWNENRWRPMAENGHLVAQDGGHPRGEHAWTLRFTDIKTGWTECAATRNKAQQLVFTAIRLAQRRLPFPLLGVDSDNGSEFINDELLRYCMEEHLTFTRGRQGRKNDNAHVEQKNWSVVRRFVGDQRFDTLAQLKLLDQLYELLHSYVNFFLPVMKLQEKVRQGNKVKRIDDKPQTPVRACWPDPTCPAKSSCTCAPFTSNSRL